MGAPRIADGQIRAEMARLHREIRARYERTFATPETPEQRDERHRLTHRWYELRRQLRAS